MPKTTPYEDRRLLQPDQCTTEHFGPDTNWPAAVERITSWPETPSRQGWCLGHALILTCPNEGCGTIVAFCHLTGCGECRPVSNAAGVIIHQIFDAQI